MEEEQTHDFFSLTCPICKCKMAAGKVVVNFEDFKTILKRVFTDHAVYTSLLIMQSVPTLQPDASVITERLLLNPKDIRNLLEPFLGSKIGMQLEEAFTQHLKLAAGTLEPLRLGKKREVQDAVNKLVDQGVKVGTLLGSINPSKLSTAVAIKEFETHNNFVVELATLRSQGKYIEYINLYDIYFDHMMGLSDLITIALVPNCII